MHDIKAHPDGLCAACQVPETIEHVLLGCSASEIPIKLKAKYAQLQAPPTLTTILSSRELQDLVFDLAVQHSLTL